MSVLIYCLIPEAFPSQASSLYPYYISGLDTLAWRFGIPETIYPEALIPGMREIGHSPLNTWGNLYPRSGFINQTSDPKAGAVIAQRVGNIVTQPGQPHIYTPLQGGGGIRGGMKVWPPTMPLKEMDGRTGKWQMLSPKTENKCRVFGVNDVSKPTEWGAGKVAKTGSYAWTLWRPYKCCKKRGQWFLFSINFKPYP